MKREVYVYLDNIRSAHNVGSVFRTADGAGVCKVILGGYTPAPIDRFGRTQPEINKTSLGACEYIPWQSLDDVAGAEELRCLQNKGFSVVAVEQSASAISLHELVVPNKVVYIFGNETDGVSNGLLDLSDTVVEIPMHGQKESLNVAVTAGVILFH
ncbi:TrmH family RNA methyltransferase [Candidatus Nomurabacteria bacterium]|nr:TrmH family RNA methyltransferase [Candidatus Nomurabacteria bacterium]